jgi:hypothetical protein
MLAKFRKLQFRFLVYLLKRDFPQWFEDLNRETVIALASNVSVKLTQQHLEREGFIHCKNCAQRFGLRKLAGDYYCQRHAPQLVAA